MIGGVCLRGPGVTIYPEPLIVGMKDKHGKPIEVVSLDGGRTVFMTPDAFNKLKKLVDQRDGAP